MERKDFDLCFDFEDSGGQLSESEIETNGTVDQVNTAAMRHGRYGMKITFDGTGYVVYVGDYGGQDTPEWYARFYIYVDSNIGGLDASSIYFVGAIYDATLSYAIGLYIYTDGSGNPLGWYYADSGGLVAYDLSLTADVWEMLEVYWKKAVAGKLEGRLNGVAFSNQGAGDNSAIPSTGDSIFLGAMGGVHTLFPANTEFLYYDDFVIVDGAGWIGEYAIPWDRRHMNG